VPKWKVAAMAKKGGDQAAATKEFAEKWGMVVV
jgi:hypothetical protein